MSAEYLMETSALMRERAEGATPGPWGAANCEPTTATARRILGNYTVVYSDTKNPAPEVAVLRQGWTDAESKPADAAYIAAMSPAVALAVAKLLEGVAERHAPMGHPMFGVLCCLTCNLDLEGDERGHCDDLDDALAVARAYRGDS